MPQRGTAELTTLEIVAPSDHMRSGHRAKFFGPHDTRKAHEVVDRVLVGSPRMDVPDVGEPFEFRGYVGQAVKLGGGQQPFGRGDRSRRLGGDFGVLWRAGHTDILFVIKSVVLNRFALVL